MDQIGTNQIENGAITSTKPAESLMKKIAVFDTLGGHAVGWNPDGATAVFEISEPLAADSSSAIINVDSTIFADPVCSASQVFSGEIEIFCTSPPAAGSSLDYTITNLPPNIIA